MYNATSYVVGGVVLNGYLLSIIGTVLVCSILTAILPSGKTHGVIKGIAKLVCVITIISPIPKFIGNWSFFDKNNKKNSGNNTVNLAQTVIPTDESFIKYYCEMRVQNAEISLNEEIKEKFFITATSDITWKFQAENDIDSDTIQIVKISVKLENGDEQTRQAVGEYLRKNYCSEVQIE